MGKLCLALLIFFTWSVAAAAGVAGPTPILYLPDDCLMGATVNGRFVDGKAAAPQLGKSPRPYHLYAQSGRTITQTCSAPDPDSEGVEPGRAHDFTVRCALEKPAAPVTDPFLIGIGSAVNPLPRPVTIIKGNPAIYRQAVQEFLRSAIPNSPVTLDRVIRVDLEGDGTDEVLIAAHYFARGKTDGALPTRGKPGWYSLVLLRKIEGGQVKTSVIAEDIYPTAGKLEERVITFFTVTAVFDVDGDGKYELLLNDRYYEGDYTHLIRFDGRNTQRSGKELGSAIATCGWGA